MNLNCPDNTIFNSTLSICMNPNEDIVDGCTCPGGYANGAFVPSSSNCQYFFICVNGTMKQIDCGPGNYFNQAEGICEQDLNGSCLASTRQYSCVGAYQEGDFIAHPTNRQLFYVCDEAQLQLADCGFGNIFDASLGFCTHPNARTIQKRSAAIEEFACLNDSMRSVPSNCSQYEICIEGLWQRRSCTNQRYYNPEQQLCLEPRDDAVCAYAKVTGLPACNNNTAYKTLPSKTANCMQYYICHHEKWHLRSCNKRQYYSTALQTCITTDSEIMCSKANATSNTTTILAIATTTTTTTTVTTLTEATAKPKCQHTAVRYYAYNCGMYLMCRENEWWYQYCPPGMYFNRTQNFCMPSTGTECEDVSVGTANETNDMQTELLVLKCSKDGALRPSALACDKYFMCVNGMWQTLQCKVSQYFNVTAEACMHDEEGVCAELQAECGMNETREFPLNCTAYERCIAGKWQRFNCPQGYVYDSIIGECVQNDGKCVAGGFRKACSAGETRSHPLAENCTQFYYCEQDKWHVGSCLRGNTYDAKHKACVPHLHQSKCTPAGNNSAAFHSLEVALSELTDVCVDKIDGSAVPHPEDCSRFYVCLNGAATKEMYCTTGSYFETKLGYCLPNDGTCRIPLTGACANATDESYVAHPLDCRAYYYCSSLNGTQLLHCPEGEYFHKFTHQCRIDHGQCHQPANGNKCSGLAHGILLPHETYCNIYYACVRGIAIPVECPQEYIFNDVLGHCVYDVAHQCENGELTNANGSAYSCGNLTAGVYLPDRTDCTRYYICTEGEAVLKRCGAGSFFDSHELLCVPDDGSCPYVDNDQPNNQHVPPDPIVCEGKHGNMMPDPANCNEFYVCINGKLRHERCYTDHFFNSTSYQCQPYQRDAVVDYESANATATATATAAAAAAVTTEALKTLTRSSNFKQCIDKPTNFSDLCTQIPEGTTVAEQGDCRRYVACEENGAVSLRCRNGESYDSLLGFCRQNDGTCLLENGERVGVCNKHHGQLVRDADNCRGYFVCINGQRIAGVCAEDEYFSKTLNMCKKDVLGLCTSNNDKSEDTNTVSCSGLSETLLYPYVQNQCRSYFQCVKGVPKFYECADGQFFNATTTRCVKEITECGMPSTQVLQRGDLEQKNDKCENVVVNYPYANTDDKCRSFYVCQANGTIAYEDCAPGKLFSDERSVCLEAKLVECNA